MRQKLIAGAIGIALLSLAGAGAFAAQDAVHTQADPSATAEPTHTPRPHPTKAADELNTAKTEEPGDADTADEPDGPDAGEREIKGIPTTNPNFHAEDGNGTCEHGESVVKTTTAGTMVNVPCEAVEHGNSGHGHGGPDADETPEAESGSSD
jgi:hypothetical protein